jgi:hypothetical protein
MKVKLFKLLIPLILLGFISRVSADRRSYVWTYEYKTVGKGEAELEHYLTLSSPDISEMEGKVSVEHQLELEVGMTNNFDFSIYQIFYQPPMDRLQYKGFKLRARYRIGERGKLILDPLLYFEYKGVPDFSEHGIEFKLILAKDIKKLNISLNPILEFDKKDEWEMETEYAIGMSYEFSKLLRLGIEAKGSEYGNYIGPVISHGRDDLWVALGSAFKIGKIKENKPEFQIRLILGVNIGGKEKKGE